MYSFDYVPAGSIADAEAIHKINTEARYLAGGQTLIPAMKQRLLKPPMLIDLKSVSDLKGIHRAGHAFGLGALATHQDVALNADLRQACPALTYLAGEIADPAVRSRGTIGGSLANNDPAADYPAAMLALGATIVTGQRRISADNYFTGFFKTALEPGELITGVGFQVPQKAGYAKLAQRASRFALVGVFVAKFEGGVRVAVTGAGEGGVFRVPVLEDALSRDFSTSAIASINVPATGLMSDLHAPADYRAAMITVMTERAVEMALGVA